MDINLDGITDLIVGAPGVGSESLMYNVGEFIQWCESYQHADN